MTTETPAAHLLFLRKAEFLHLVNSGRIRLLRNRIVAVDEGFARVFATGITTSPTDADNCVVVGLASSWQSSEAHPLAVKKDLVWLAATDIAVIRPVKEVDVEPLREVVPPLFLPMFAGPVEHEWRSWLVRESVIIHLEVARQLLAWSGQKQLTATDLKSPALNDLMASMLGFGDESPDANRPLAAGFFAMLPKVVRVLGPAVGTLHSPFRLARAWVELRSSAGSMPDEDVGVAKFLRSLEKGDISVSAIEASKVAKKIRAVERRHGKHFDKQLRPILMAAVADTNYRIVGGLFTADDFKRCLSAVSTFDGPVAARTYTMYTACRLGPEVVYTTLLASAVPAATDAPSSSVEAAAENTGAPLSANSDPLTLGI